jgi:hypothetical protein
MGYSSSKRAAAVDLFVEACVNESWDLSKQVRYACFAAGFNEFEISAPEVFNTVSIIHGCGICNSNVLANIGKHKRVR